MKATSTSVPVPPARFVGRTVEMTAVGDLLRRREVRLLTLVGVGGCGKTRLALEAVRRFASDSQQPIAFVDLAPLPSAELVSQTIAQVLELGQQLRDEELVEALRDQSVLLVLDNFEHVLSAAGLVFSLLSACPALRLLITSRAVLGIRGEDVFSVRPMQSDQCVQLFIDRARAADSRFVVADGDEPILTEICARLDGLPLAVELAAARVRTLPPKSLVTRLQPRLSLLSGGGRDRPTRHQAIRNTIEWSYRLLSDADRALFRRLAVLRGSWTLEAADSVASDIDIDMLAGVASLVDNSLVESVPTPSGEPRFRMLETIREFALEQLEASGETEGAARGLVDYLVKMCESDVRERGSAQAARFAQLDLELDNIRAALTWSLGSARDVEHGMHLAALLLNFWKEGARWTEGRQWLERTLATPDPVDPVVLAAALTAAGDLAYLQGDSIRAREYLKRGLELWRRQSPHGWLSKSLRLMARIAIGDGQFSVAQSLCEEALEVATQSGFGVETGLALNAMGMVHQAVGDLKGAMMRYEQGLQIMRELDDLPGSAFILLEIGQVAELGGDLGRATEVFAEGLEISQRAGDRKEAARCLVGLARIALRGDGNLASAEALASQSVDLFRALGADHEVEQAQAIVALAQERRHGTFRPRSRRSDGLTEREAQIVGLIAEGASNAAIGARLLLSVRTVERHIENIYAKLGVQGRTARAAVAGYAVRSASTDTPTRAKLRVHTDEPRATIH
jgi:predicted ATPase/DNA-binding CsgD family transcriptional regulator